MPNDFEGFFCLIVYAAVGWVARHFGLPWPMKQPEPAPAPPLPDEGEFKTGRPILDLLAKELLIRFGSNPLLAAAIKAELKALKEILDKAGVPVLPSGQEVKK